MKFETTPIPGAYVVYPNPRADERGFLARTYCEREFGAQHLNTHWVQFSTVFNKQAGTLRGMHYQIAPHEEIKVVRCTSGVVWDVIVDLRPDSLAYCRWFGVELSAENRASIYIPAGIAHGMQTLVDGAELLYMMSAFYAPDAARGARWNDPIFGIVWPAPPAGGRIIHPKDEAWPEWKL